MGVEQVAATSAAHTCLSTITISPGWLRKGVGFEPGFTTRPQKPDILEGFG